MIARGGAGRLEDDELADAAFLWLHPTWTYAALQATPARIVEAIKHLDRSSSS